MSTELQKKHAHFLSLLAPIRSGLARFCRVISRDDEAARDLTSQTILIAYEHLDSLRDPERFRSYCFQVASRLAKRSRWRERNRVAYDQTLTEAIADAGPSPEIAAEVRELYEALATLPQNMRDAVILFEINGLSLDEIKGIQGGSLSGVKSRIARGRARLSRILGEGNNVAERSSLTLGVEATERQSYRFARTSVPAPAKSPIL